TAESPRQSARGSSARAFASSRPSRWTAPARREGGPSPRRSEAVPASPARPLSAGSAMRTCAAPLAAALAFRFGRGGRAWHEFTERGGRLGRGRLLRLFEDDRSRIGSRPAAPWTPLSPPGGRAAVGLRAFRLVDASAACELRLALLQDRQQRCRDEDRRVGARGDPNQQRECEVL